MVHRPAAPELSKEIITDQIIQGKITQFLGILDTPIKDGPSVGQLDYRAIHSFFDGLTPQMIRKLLAIGRPDLNISELMTDSGLRAVIKSPFLNDYLRSPEACRFLDNLKSWTPGHPKPEVRPTAPEIPAQGRMARFLSLFSRS